MWAADVSSLKLRREIQAGDTDWASLVRRLDEVPECVNTGRAEAVCGPRPGHVEKPKTTAGQLHPRVRSPSPTSTSFPARKAGWHR